ncbi:hypothetical protein [Spirosoma koreense]
MLLNLKPYYWLLVVIAMIFVLIGVVGDLIIPGGVTSLFWQKVGPYAVFGLIFMVILTLVPIALKGFILAQYKLGNGDQPIVHFLDRHVKKLVRLGWVVLILGLAVALPFMLKAGFFEPSSTESRVPLGY